MKKKEADQGSNINQIGWITYFEEDTRHYINLSLKKTVGLNLRILDMCKLQQNQLYMYKQTLKYLYNFWS